MLQSSVLPSQYRIELVASTLSTATIASPTCRRMGGRVECGAIFSEEVDLIPVAGLLPTFLVDMRSQ